MLPSRLTLVLFATTFLIYSCTYGSLLAADCNSNGTDDAEDLTVGASLDCNRNGVPDECDPLFPGELLIDRTDRGEVWFPSDPEELAVADFDGDGHIDLAKAFVGSKYVSMLAGEGNGRFQPDQRVPLTGYVRALVAADANGDGRVDLLVSYSDDQPGREGIDQRQGGVAVLLGNGDGTFQLEQKIPLERAPYHLAAADLNSDRRVDLVATDGIRESSISGLDGNGDGTFQQEQGIVKMTDTAWDSVGADVNGDGRLDVIALYNNSSGDGGVFVLLANGDGTFQSEQRYSFLGLGYRPSSFVLTDFDSDGRVDIITAGTCDSLTHAMLRGNGDGTFQIEPPFFAKCGANALVAADFDRDGSVDLAGVDWSALVSVLLGNGAGAFQDQRSFAVNGGSALVAADFNGDARWDLATAKAAWSGASVLLGNGDGDFQADPRIPVDGGAGVLLGVYLDGDSRIDLVTASEGGTVSVLQGKADGTFKTSQQFPMGTNPIGIVAADFTGDALIDLATVPTFSANALFYLGIGNGDGTFQDGEPVATGSDLSELRPSALVAMDLNGDGVSELAIANSGSDDVTVAGFVFGLVEQVPVGDYPIAICAADLDGDGRMDLATANALSGDLSLLLGNGDGTFKPEQRQPLVMPYGKLAAADLKADGRMDLVGQSGACLLGQGCSCGRLSRTIGVSLGNGDGTFEMGASFTVAGGSPQTGPYFPGPYTPVVGDFDGDGRSDIASLGCDNIAVLRGNGDGTLRAEQYFPAGGAPASLVATDLDGDGRLDLAVANSSDIRILLNESPQDLLPPIVTCPEDWVVECTSPEGAVVDFHATAEDDCDPDIALAYDPQPETLLAPGVTLVTCTARDARGNESRCTFEVTVTCGLQKPGDCNQDGTLDISDGICLLGHLFLGSPSRLPCTGGTIHDAGNISLFDANGDSFIDLSDAVSELQFLFGGGKPPVLGTGCTRIDGCPSKCK